MWIRSKFQIIGHPAMAEDLHKVRRPYFSSLPLLMTTAYQMNITGKSEFVPPRVNYRRFLDHVFLRAPNLLDPIEHGSLLVEFARFAGLKPDSWGMNLDSLVWLFKCSPDLERACRSFRADAY